jgi:hypothetical protein
LDQGREAGVHRARRRPIRFRTQAAGWLAAAVALVLAGGCASRRDDDLYGMVLDVRTRQVWGTDPELRYRVHDVLEASCEQLGLDPSMLWGMTLRIEDGAIDCGPVENARGCTWRDAGTVAVSTTAWTTCEPPVPCVEDTPIPHELLHVAIGDPQHLDPRWNDQTLWRSLAARLARPDCSGDPPNLVW